MDRSLDSIGSCSLDVDADFSDISDTSGSLNFPTPLSVKDITREFTANIRERCTLRSPLQPHQSQFVHHSTTAYVDPGTGLVRMVLSPPAAVNEASPVDSADEVVEKKPSYLNLACCVNGYSNLTTYDSKIRQDINKSREVSPIRPSTSSLQYCKRQNSLAAPQLLIGSSMPHTKQPQLIEANNNIKPIMSNGHSLENGKQPASTSSFIQQRVERLYGPGALAQGFYSPKKHGQGLSPARQTQLEVDSSQSTELARKFKQLSPSKDYGEFRKKLDNNCSHAERERERVREREQSSSAQNGSDVDLPVFRHLSHEFRAQLPTVSPKRNVPRVSPPLDAPVDVVDHESVSAPQLHLEEYMSTTKILPAETSAAADIVAPAPEKDGNYFLKILKTEQARLLALAAVAEKYTDALVNNPDITEDTFGLLRSASGKARLLASQKMKQFEGLCHNNLNRSPEDEFPTTLDDLQGFWDMVFLQVEHVNSIFAEIEHLKSNDWKRTMDSQREDTVSIIKTTKSAKTGNSVSKTKSGGSTNNNSSVNSSKSAAVNSAAALKREAQRKQLLEMKRQRREAMAAAAKNQSACDGATELQEAIGDSSINNIVTSNIS